MVGKLLPSFLFSVVFSLGGLAQSPPTQPASGPGGSDYIHADVVMHTYDAQHDGFHIFEPASPVPDSANVVVFIHGLSIVNPYLYGGWITHLVRKGNIVIYPKYQDAAGSTPEADFNDNVVHAIVTALDTLELPGHVKPRTQNLAVAGHSYGGLMTSNMGILAATSGFPIPKCLFVCQPYNDSGTNVRLPDYSIMPADMNLLIMVGDNDFIVGTTFGRFLMDSTTNVSTTHKNYIIHHGDNHGSPSLGASHFEPCSKDNDYDTEETNLFTIACDAGTKTDAVDYYGYWKLLDALLDCSFNGQNCEYAFGDTPEQRGLGQWSDGQPLVEMTVEPSVTDGVGEYAGNVQFEVYPNPATDMVTINWKGQENASIEIIDVLGKVVMSEQSLVVGRTELNTTYLSNGTHLIRMTQGEKVGIRKLVIQRAE